jgi:hypothetical protein
MSKAIETNESLKDEYWVLEFVDGEYKRGFLYLTEHHQNVYKRETPKDADKFSTKELADQAINSNKRYNLVARHVKVVYTLT